MIDPNPPRNCPHCPRLVAYRTANQAAHPDWFNGPAPGWGDPNAWLLIVGLAPGVSGANRTGRPFTGDYAGILLYETLLATGLAQGSYDARPDDGLTLHQSFITNAVRCVPPENKPRPDEIRTCQPFLAAQIAALPKLTTLIALGQIAHQAVIRTLGGKQAAHPFGHGAQHRLGALTLFDSYHCSRYNTNTGRLTPAMFRAVFDLAIANARR